jgi:hypothetical protein
VERDLAANLAVDVQCRSHGRNALDGQARVGQRIDDLLAASWSATAGEAALSAAAVFEAEYGKHGEKLQAAAVATFLLVADAHAWETDCLRLLYLDAKGNIVRHSTVEVEDAWYTRCWFDPGKMEESLWWPYKHDLMSGELRETGSELGEKYLAHGEMGRSLYGLDCLELYLSLPVV